MPIVIANVTLKAGGEYHPPGSSVEIKDPAEANDLVSRKAAHWPDGAATPPASEPPPAAEFPDDFPGREALVAAGILTFAALREAGDLTQIKGIGQATAKKVEAAIPPVDPASDGDGDGEERKEDDKGEEGKEGDGDDEPPKEVGEPGVDAIET